MVRKELRKKVNICISKWKECLKHHKCERPMFPWDEVRIARAVQQYGPEMVEYAILGATVEKGFKEFNPSEHVTLNRIFNPMKIERFVNLGAKEKTRLERKAANDKRIEELKRPESSFLQSGPGSR